MTDVTTPHRGGAFSCLLPDDRLISHLNSGAAELTTARIGGWRRMDHSAREEEWAAWMRAAMAGDTLAYHRFLKAVTPYLRSIARRRCDQFGAPASDVEDVVQEVLLAVHLKRGTWDMSRPVGPWLSAIVRNKLVDSLRRRGRQVSVRIEDVMETLEATRQDEGADQVDVDRMVDSLRDPQREIVRSISLGGAGIRETAERLQMTEGAVRVALHRALKGLAALYRSDRRANG
ncbi:RNA polymerase sigma-70 factor, ECF subfamily [Pleomorphomonas diazotrophica]|nr:RNA polymerase sigma-70 factor, ECF subfamily [Pleomorphomonas diazotrophica]